MSNCSCTGHRPKGFPYPYGIDKQKQNVYMQTLLQNVELAIIEYGMTNFVSGMAVGVDMDFAETIIKLRNKYPVTLECAIPCPNQTYKWNEHDKLRYEKIIKQADEVTLVSERYTPECMWKRNRYIVDKSDLVLAVFNGIEKGGTWYTIRYARKMRIPILMINLNQL